MKIAKQHRTRGEWMELVVACERSGIGRAEFARREGLHARTFAWWASKLAPRAKASRPAKGLRVASAARATHLPSTTFVPLLVAAPSPLPTSMPRTAPSRSTSGEAVATVVEIVLGNGRVVRVDLAHAGDSRLARVLSVAEGRLEC